MYIRFVTGTLDEDSRKPRGLFTEAFVLLRSGDLEPEESKQLRTDMDWFNDHLPAPPKRFTTSRAIFWFRQDASECIDKVWEVVHLLRTHDRYISVLKCRHLRNVTYSDRFQVAAYPHSLDDRIIEH